MASNLPPLWRFDYGDYTPLGSVFQKFLSNLNLFTMAIYNLVNKGIGFANLQRSVYNVTVQAATNTTISFVNPLAIAPSGLSLVKVLLNGENSTPITSAVSVANWFYDGKYINILSVPGLTAGSSYNLSIEVM